MSFTDFSYLHAKEKQRQLSVALHVVSVSVKWLFVWPKCAENNLRHS